MLLVDVMSKHCLIDFTTILNIYEQGKGKIMSVDKSVRKDTAANLRLFNELKSQRHRHRQYIC